MLRVRKALHATIQVNIKMANGALNLNNACKHNTERANHFLHYKPCYD
jgi:hypothetical protein